MSRHALQHVGVFVLHFALNAAMTERGVLFRGRNRASRLRIWAKSRGRHLQWPKNLAPKPGCQMFSHLHLQRFTEQDEARVGVLNSRSRLRLQR